MTPLITVTLAIATTLSVFAIAIAKGDVLKNAPDWLVPLLIGASAALYVLAGILALIHWKKERRSESDAILPSFSQVITQEASPRIENTVIVHRDTPTPPKRTPAERHAFESVKAALDLTKDTGLAALRHLKNHGTLVFGTYDPELPPGLKRDQALWVYNHCLSVGIVTRKANLGHSEFVYSLSPNPAILKALDDLLFPENGFSGFTDVRHK
jgi:hypothetical protein